MTDLLRASWHLHQTDHRFIKDAQVRHLREVTLTTSPNREGKVVLRGGAYPVGSIELESAIEILEYIVVHHNGKFKPRGPTNANQARKNGRFVSVKKDSGNL